MARAVLVEAVMMSRAVTQQLVIALVGLALTSVACQTRTDDEDDVDDANNAFSLWSSPEEAGKDYDCAKGWYTCSGTRWLQGLSREEALSGPCMDGKVSPPGKQRSADEDVKTSAGRMSVPVDCRMDEAKRRTRKCRAYAWTTCSGGGWVKGLPAAQAKPGGCEIQSKKVQAGDQVAIDGDGLPVHLYIPGVCQ